MPLRRGDRSRPPLFYGGGGFTLGHETGGRIAGWGPGVTGFEVGQPVVAHAEWGCGRCSTCRHGDERLCPEVAPTMGAGLGLDGGMARYLLVPAARYIVPLVDLDPVDAGPLDDAALTPYHAIRTAAGELGAGGSVAVVIGAGGVGHMAIQILKAITPATVVVVELDEARRRFALDIGADLAVHPDDDVNGQVRGLRKEGASAVFDLVGNDATLALAGSLASQRGRVVLVGTALGSFPFNLLSLPWECRLHTTYARRAPRAGGGRGPGRGRTDHRPRHPHPAGGRPGGHRRPRPGRPRGGPHHRHPVTGS